jgi:hypothetical protein
MFPNLQEGEAVKAASTLEAGITRRFPFTVTLDECLDGAIYLAHDILRHLRVDLVKFWACCFSVRQFHPLLTEGGFLVLPTFPRRLTVFQGGVAECATAVQYQLKRSLLIWCSLQCALRRFADGLCPALLLVELWTHSFGLPPAAKTKHDMREAVVESGMPRHPCKQCILWESMASLVGALMILANHPDASRYGANPDALARN